MSGALRDAQSDRHPRAPNNRTRPESDASANANTRPEGVATLSLATSAEALVARNGPRLRSAVPPLTTARIRTRTCRGVSHTISVMGTDKGLRTSPLPVNGTRFLLGLHNTPLMPTVPPTFGSKDSQVSSAVVLCAGAPAVIHASELAGAPPSNGVSASLPLATTTYGSLVHAFPLRLPACALSRTSRSPPTRPAEHAYVRSITDVLDARASAATSVMDSAAQTSTVIPAKTPRRRGTRAIAEEVRATATTISSSTPYEFDGDLNEFEPFEVESGSRRQASPSAPRDGLELGVPTPVVRVLDLHPPATVGAIQARQLLRDDAFETELARRAIGPPRPRSTLTSRPVRPSSRSRRWNPLRPPADTTSVRDVDAWWAKLRDRAEVVEPLMDTPYGTRKFTIRDLGGNELGFVRED